MWGQSVINFNYKEKKGENIMNNLVISNVKIENMIYEIRGKQVMLDSDLAKLYQCKNGTKSINLAVSRNKERFPNDFYFQLTQEEYMNLKFQFETSSLNNYGGVRKLPYVFTQEGVSMLASVLRTSIAAEVSVNIMRAFVTMKKYISNSLLEQRYINDMVLKDNKRIDLLEEAFSQFDAYKENSNEIYFEGQIYDAYSKITDIMKQAKKELIIVDAYADKNVLDMIKGLNCRVKIISRDNACLKKLDIEKYNSQYNNLEIIYSVLFMTAI